MPSGLLTTYDLTVGVIVDIEDMIHLISPFEVPLQGGQGADGNSALATGTCFEKRKDWLDEELLLPRSTIQTTTTTGDGWIHVAAGHQLRFQTGDVLLLQSGERVRVTGYGTTADTLLATRGFSSTTAATATAGNTVTGYGSALPEGSAAPAARALDRVNRFNITEIFGPTKVDVTGTENVVRKYGLSGTTEFDKQAGNRMKEQSIQIEQAILYGTLLEDTTNKWRTMGGLQYFISTNVDSTTTILTETALLDQIQITWDAGGEVDRAVLGAKQKRTGSAFNTNIDIQVARADNGRGQTVDYFDSDFGRVSLLLNRWCRTSDLFLFNRDQAELLTLRPMQFEMLGKTADSQQGHILAEKTFVFRRQQHAARFSALT